MFGGVFAKREGLRSWLSLCAACLALAIAGCGGNAAKPPANAAGGQQAGANDAAPGADVEVAGDGKPGADADRVNAKTPLIQGIGELLDSNPALEDDTKNPLREQLKQADDILSSIKAENRAVLKEVNRQQRTRRSTSPNVVVMVINDLAIGDLACYGNPGIQTPNIDRLAASGTRFTQFYAGSPHKADAHWCLAAGRRPDESTHWSNALATLVPENITVAEAMWQGGYRTGLFGDWGVLGPAGPSTPEDQGFDEWAGTFAAVDSSPAFPASILYNGRPIKFSKNASNQQGQPVQDFYVAEAMNFLLRGFRQHPLYLQIHFSTTGGAATSAELEPYADRPWSDAAKQRAAALTRIDRDIGKLLQRLSDIKQIGNTVFVLTSDTPGKPATAAAGDGAATALRGNPGELYEGGLRIPLILTGKARIPVNQTCDAVSAMWDLPPTIYQLTATLKQAPHKAGQSLLPFLVPNAKLPVRFLYWEKQHGKPEIAARWKNWKVVRPEGQSQFELYDLETDPGESKNVVQQYPDVIAEINKRLNPQTDQAKQAKQQIKSDHAT